MVEDKKDLPVGSSEDKTAEYKDYKSKGKRFKSNRSQRRGFKGKGLPTKGGNDFAFWNEYPELMGIATRFPWMHVQGTQLRGTNVNVAIPNVAVQYYVSVPGFSKAATDPLNLAFRQIYLDMHRKYRGIGAYQASDIAIALICIESVLQLLVEAERIYGILKGYPIKSRVEPEGLLRAMGFSVNFINSIKSDLANYRYSINRLIELAKRLPLPAGMNFFRNHVALNGFVYRDSQDERAGYLLFLPQNYYSYRTTGQTGCINNASTAYSRPIQRTIWNSYDQFISLIETELNTLLTDTDILRITSDFIACYGESNMQVLMPLPEDYHIEALYNESILHKWHNSEHFSMNMGFNANIGYMAIGTGTTTLNPSVMSFAVYQVNDVIISAPTISNHGAGAQWEIVGPGEQMFGISAQSPISAAEANKGFVLDSWMADPDEGFRCESVLWKQVGEIREDQGNDPVGFAFNMCGTEILSLLTVTAIVNSSPAGTEMYETSFDAQNTSAVQDALIHLDWHPYTFTLDNTGAINKILGDTDNITLVDRSVIAKILDAANLSAFKVTLTGGKASE